jgi:6-phosphofructokinase 1
MANLNVSLKEFSIPVLGKPLYETPLLRQGDIFVDDTSRVAYPRHTTDIQYWLSNNEPLPSFESAGPRKSIYFDPPTTNCGIVTCGGLCPGTNDVVRAIVFEACDGYGIRRVYGFRYGFEGLVRQNGIAPVVLDTEFVDDIHEKGGTILGTSRGPQDVGAMADFLQELDVSVLFVIGGDGTLRGAEALVAETQRRKLPVSIICVPKTIDNDISFVESSFGFDTAVQEAMAVIQSAHTEAKGAKNGVGIVKLMGRDSGFIAALATVANMDVNFCFVPEVPFSLDGDQGLLSMLEKRMARRGHAVIVVAEGAGQDMIIGERKRDASGNILHKDIGLFIKDRISAYFKGKGTPITIRYIDPSYIIRSRPANAHDSWFCLQMGQHAVHAGMSGRTGMLIGYWNSHYTHVPLSLAVSERKMISPQGSLWQTVMSMTEQGKFL